MICGTWYVSMLVLNNASSRRHRMMIVILSDACKQKCTKDIRYTHYRLIFESLNCKVSVAIFFPFFWLIVLRSRRVLILKRVLLVHLLCFNACCMCSKVMAAVLQIIPPKPSQTVRKFMRQCSTVHA